jgi:hypothetical protein
VKGEQGWTGESEQGEQEGEKVDSEMGVRVQRNIWIQGLLVLQENKV